MQHRIETARIARRLFLAVTVWVMVLPVMGYAQTWPDPPEVNGAFSADDLARAVQIESELSCHRDMLYCSDPEVQEFRRRLQEVAAAALTRMPDIEQRHDVVPSSVNVFHQNLLRCRGHYPLNLCSRSSERIRGSHETLADFPQTILEGDACAATVEKACLLDLLSDRIAAWNRRNTEDDENPVVALHDPGFDCLRGQRSAAMHTICRNGELSALHRVMLENLAALPAEVDPRTQLGYATNAIQQGGFFGTGVGEGQVKWSLPDAHTDFIIAVAAEEYGLILVLIIIALYAAIVIRSLLRLQGERDPFVRIAGTGLACAFGVQALINMGVAVRLLPAKGMTLPFVSYGGSSLVAMGLMIGMLLALTRARPQGEIGDILLARGR